MTGRDYMEIIAGLPCIVCWKKLGQRTHGVEVHHVQQSNRSDFATIPLCVEHHRGPTGVHGLHRRGFERFWKVDNETLLAWTNEARGRFT